jgi:hypothetical protein
MHLGVGGARALLPWLHQRRAGAAVVVEGLVAACVAMVVTTQVYN